MQANRYECTKCQETMTSKCPVSRNVFPSDIVASMMTNVSNIYIEQDPDLFGGRRVVTLEFPYLETEDRKDWSGDDLELEAIKMIRSLSEETVRHWLCDHNWKKLKKEG